MAASPVGAVKAGPPNLEFFDLENVKLNGSNFWASAHVPISSQNGSVGSAPSDEEEDASQKTVELRRRFHTGRYLLIRQIPRDTTEKELEEAFAPQLELYNVQLQPSSQSATAHVRRPELLEDPGRYADVRLGSGGGPLAVSLSATDGLLCTARLPASVSDEELTRTAEMYGPVRYAFVLRSDSTGASKGYGFVMYASKEAAFHAKSLLDGKLMAGSAIKCDWIDPTHTTLRSLHSKCLHVANLPDGYKNMGEFRQLFSCVRNPPYCQIALKNGSPQDWGLVEFTSAEEAEMTRQRMQGHVLRGSRIQVHFCMPGVRAIDIYMRLLNEAAAPRSRLALLPDPPPPAVYQQMKSLSQQNPAFAQNLHNIVTSQISELQQEIAAQAGYTVPPPPLSVAAAVTAASPHRPPPPPPHTVMLGQPMLFPGGMVGLVPPPPPSAAAAAAAAAASPLRPMAPPPPFYVPGLPPHLLTAGQLLAPPPVSSASGYPLLPPVSAASGFSLLPPVSAASGFPLLPPVSAASGFSVLPPVSVASGFSLLPPVSAASGFSMLPPMTTTGLLLPPLPTAGAPPDAVSHVGDELQNTITSLMSKAQGLHQMLALVSSQKGAPTVPLPPTPPADDQQQYVSSLLAALHSAQAKAHQPGAGAAVPFSMPSPLAGSPVTPQGQKRKYHHLLPSPEPSPDTEFVGQHSQGIGGHYAETYLKRKRY